MNAVSYVLQRLLNGGIPNKILRMAFKSRLSNNVGDASTLEYAIREKVLDARVLIDVGLLHTTQMTIPLVKCERIVGDYYTATYRVPNELTQGKRIVSVLHVTAAAGTIVTQQGNAAGTQSGGLYSPSIMADGMDSSLLLANNVAMNTLSPIPVVSNALTYLVGYNTVMIKDSVIIPSTMHLRVNVENDSNMSHLNTPIFPRFYKLCLLAAKSIIYNLLVEEQDSVFIHAGGEWNKFRDIVESYESAAEEYELFLDDFYQSALLDDQEQQRRHYQMRFGGGYQ